MYHWIFLLVTVVTIGINGLASYLPLNGVDTGSISDNLSTVLTPVGLTFSIWSIIYLGLLTTAGGILLGKIKAGKKFVRRYLASGLANCGWIFAWHYGWMWGAALLLPCLLVCLFALMTYLNTKSHPHTGRGMVARTTFHIYLGWVLVATLVMTTIFAKYSLGILEGTTEIWRATGCLLLGTLANLYLMVRWKQLITSLVFIRASTGIVLAGTNEFVSTIALLMIMLLLLAISGHAWKFMKE